EETSTTTREKESEEISPIDSEPSVSTTTEAKIAPEDTTDPTQASATEVTDTETLPEAHSTVLNGFSVPLPEGTEVSGGQFRISSAAKEKQLYMNEYHTISVNYSLDGGSTWRSSGFVDIDDEVS